MSFEEEGEDQCLVFKNTCIYPTVSRSTPDRVGRVLQDNVNKDRESTLEELP